MTADLEAAFGRAPFYVRSATDAGIEVDWVGHGDAMADVDRDFYASYAAVAGDTQTLERAINGATIVYRVEAGPRRFRIVLAGERIAAVIKARGLPLPASIVPAPSPAGADFWPSMKRTFLIVFAFSLTISALAGIAVLLFGTFGEMELRILATTAAFAGFSLTGLASGFWLGRGRFSGVAWGGVACSTVALVLTLWIVWADVHAWREEQFKAWAVATILAVATSHASLLLIPYGSNQIANGVIVSTLGIIGAISVILIGAILEWWDIDNEGLVRSLAALAILATLGTILGPLLRRLHR